MTDAHTLSLIDRLKAKATLKTTGHGESDYMLHLEDAIDIIRQHTAVPDADIKQIADYLWRKMQAGESGVSREMIAREIRDALLPYLRTTEPIKAGDEEAAVRYLREGLIIGNPIHEEIFSKGYEAGKADAIMPVMSNVEAVGTAQSLMGGAPKEHYKDSADDSRTATQQPEDWLGKIREKIHYPKCWDTAAYSNVWAAIWEVISCVRCSECDPGGRIADTDQKPIMRESVDLAEAYHSYHRKESDFEDKFYEICPFEYERFGCDDYDGSIEFYEVADDARLNEAACKLLAEEGFVKCYVNHKNKWETQYSALPETKSWRVSYSHKNGGKGLLVEEIPASWTADHGAIVVAPTNQIEDERT